MIKVLIVDDQKLMAEGLKSIIEFEEDIKVIDIAYDGEEAIEKCNKEQIDIVLMDVRMPKLNGVDATKVIIERFEFTKVLILTTFDEDDYIIDGLANGASGYMLKDIDGECLVEAIRSIYDGSYLLPSHIAIKLAKKISKVRKEKPSDTVLNNFTGREIEIAKMISEGFTNTQIASALFLSIGTVKNAVSNIYSKIEISDRAKAALFLKEILD